MKAIRYNARVTYDDNAFVCYKPHRSAYMRKEARGIYSGKAYEEVATEDLGAFIKIDSLWPKEDTYLCYENYCGS